MNNTTHSIQDFYKIIKDGFAMSKDQTIIDRFNNVINTIIPGTSVEWPSFASKKNFDISKTAWKASSGPPSSTNSHDRGLADIRIALNKISPKTIHDYKIKIVDMLSTIIHNIEKKHEINVDHTPSSKLEIEIIEELEESTRLNIIQESNQIATEIFNILSINKFYAPLCAELYAFICEKLPSFITPLNSEISSFILRFNNINNPDPESDYDAFCTQQKYNDKTRAIANFIALSGKGQHILPDIITLLEYKASSHNQHATADELTECACIICEIHNDTSRSLQLKHIANSNNTSLSSRAKFRIERIA